MSENYIEWIGYIASFFVATSFTFKNIKHLRIVNIFGCIFFIAYGFFIDSIPVIITNLFIMVMNLYYLIKRNNIIEIE